LLSPVEVADGLRGRAVVQFGADLCRLKISSDLSRFFYPLDGARAADIIESEWRLRLEDRLQNGESARNPAEFAAFMAQEPMRSKWFSFLRRYGAAPEPMAEIDVGAAREGGELDDAIRPGYRYERQPISEERRGKLTAELAANCMFSCVTVKDIAAKFEVPIPVYLDHVHSDWIVRMWVYSRQFTQFLVESFGRAREDEIADIDKKIADSLWTLRTGKPMPTNEEDA
jgi:hypothetical protein